MKLKDLTEAGTLPPMDVYEVVHHFLEDNSELEDGDLTFGECIMWSKALIYDLREAGFDAKLLRLAGHQGSFPNAHPEWIKLGPSFWYVHYVVLVEGWTIDVTRRQFDPNCPLPVIETLEQTKQEWADVSIVADDR